MPDILIPSLDGASFSSYLALPPARQGPGLLVIQEVFGVNAPIRDLCDRLAAAGYVTLAPDLFWRQQPDVQLSDNDPADWARACDLYQAFNTDMGLCDLLAGLAFLRRLDACNGKVGTLGLGLGGKLAFLMAARSDIDVTIGYYPLGLDGLEDEIVDIRTPVLLHLAGEDKLVPPSIRQRALDKMEMNAAITSLLYPGAGHGFARTGGQTYQQVPAQKAEAETLAFLERVLKK